MMYYNILVNKLNITMWLCLFLLLSISQVKSLDNDYYWRDYRGVIPEDAFPAGKDTNNNNVYIGQVYIHQEGIFTTSITSGTTKVKVSGYGGVESRDYIIKILCTKHQNKLKWIRTTSSTYQSDTHNKHVVEGGYDARDTKEPVYVARAFFQGILKVGNTWGTEFWFAHDDQNESLTSFEVLVYEN